MIKIINLKEDSLWGNLTLITTETFNNLSCNFYRNIFDELVDKIEKRKNMKTIIITGTPYTENEIIKKVSGLKEKSPNNILILFPEVLNGQDYVLEHPQEMWHRLNTIFDNALKENKDIIMATYSPIAVYALRIYIKTYDISENILYQIIKESKESKNVKTEFIPIDRDGKYVNEYKIHKNVLDTISKQLFVLIE